MPNGNCILCPGQGAQVVGMGEDIARLSSAAKATYDSANSVLGFDLAALCFTGPKERLDQTDISQPAIYVTSIAAYRAAVEKGLVSPETDAVYAGLSLGEYTALHLAGVFSFEDGLKLVAARGRYMQEAAVASPSGMVAVLGGDEAKVGELCAKAAGGDVLVLANFNSPGQIVISGAQAACDRAVAAAEAEGLRTSVLKVAGAFHSPLMQPAADRMAAELDKVQFSAPRRPVYANVNAEPHTDAASIKSLLVRQIVSPVRWEQSMRKVVEDPGLKFFELAPQTHLSGMLKRISRRLPVQSLGTAEAINGPKA